jgi:hypothetical protein
MTTYAIEQLSKHLYIFDEYKHISISIPLNYTEEDYEVLLSILEKFEKTCLITICLNDPKIREGKTFYTSHLPLLSKHIENKILSDDNYTFYGHSKGNSHETGNFGINCWVKYLWKYNIELFYSKVKPHFGNYKFIGVNKTKVQASLPLAWFPPFHYQGTFYWFQTKILQENNWNKQTGHILDVELWPGYMVHPKEALDVYVPTKEDGTEIDCIHFYKTNDELKKICEKILNDNENLL